MNQSAIRPRIKIRSIDRSFCVGRPIVCFKNLPSCRQMGKRNCAVIGCTNSSYRLRKRMNSTCDIHVGRNHTDCGWEPPCSLFCFPGPIISPEKKTNGLDVWRGKLNLESLGSHVAVIEFALITLLMVLPQKAIIALLRKKVDALKKENALLKCKVSNPKTNPFFSHSRIKTDKKVNFYTNISSIAQFNAIFSLLLLYLNRPKY